MRQFENALTEYASFSTKRLSLNSVRLIRICDETSHYLSTDERYQVVFYLIKLLHEQTNEQTTEFINLVADIYNIDSDKLNSIRSFFAGEAHNSQKIDFEGEIIGEYIIINENTVIIKSRSNKISINGQPLDNDIEIIGINSVTHLGNKKYYLKNFLANKTSNSPEFSLILNEVQVKKQNKELLKPFSCEIHSGELVGIMGKSGSGKTTLLKTIAGIDKNFSGQIFKHT
ncbi:MAG: ATP-binding cassette domain-containing protein, partial [Bacteroidales bacterium]|nr:ATP-binding cassette domain-containing protein [Bacteroidales bacterium]